MVVFFGGSKVLRRAGGQVGDVLDKKKKGFKLSCSNPLVFMVAREGIELPFYSLHAASQNTTIPLTNQYVRCNPFSQAVTRNKAVSSISVDQWLTNF